MSGATDPLLLRAAALPTAALCDASHKRGAFPSAIRKIGGCSRVAGLARTARCEEGSITAVFAAIEAAQPGDVLVVQGYGEWAYFGDLGGAEAARRGVCAVVIDGLARDATELATAGFPVFARGLTPRGAQRLGEGTIDIALNIGETLVQPGDLVVADRDGVVAVGAAGIEDVLGRAEAIVATEAARWRSIMSGR